MYTPPFTISAKAINLIAEISAQIERYAIRMEQSDALLLRKANRIKTIYSSLAIEGNKLTESEVTDIINGKTVVAPLHEIQEVRNGMKAYEAYPVLNVFSPKDLLKAHRLMMEALTDDAGRFRKGGVGVFSDKKLIHMAPPADRVALLIDDLFQWLKLSKDHLLIKSCVFHYEFEFIHPFSDGNGRMGRLWQSLILGQLHPLFEHLPFENMVYDNQEAYYNAIAESTKLANSGVFIDFMLNEILNTLKRKQGVLLVGTDNGTDDDIENVILNHIKNNAEITLNELSLLLGKSRRTIIRTMNRLQEENLIRRIGSNRSGYWEIIETQCK
ncbi:MAG: Fic family protein [Bacteroidales bacterium]|nr:Fic family protein [Bacteroidales bacterium]MDD4684577.1 Fic family protein [Bacteroidales bacterium]